jgi:hypothetical protein
VAIEEQGAVADSSTAQADQINARVVIDEQPTQGAIANDPNVGKATNDESADDESDDDESDADASTDQAD